MATPTSAPCLEEAVQVRPAVDGDEALIFSSWLKSYRQSPKMAGVPNGLFYRYHHPLVRRLLAQPGARVRCVCSAAHPDHVLGWMCTERMGPVLGVHYAYVKHPYRGLGVLRMLAEDAGIGADSRLVYTFSSKAAPYLARKVAVAEYVPAEDWLA